MTEHISTSRLERFSHSALPEAELNDITGHLAKCQPCHQLFVKTLRRERGTDRLEFSLAPEYWLKHEHVEFDQLAAIADDNLDETDREIIDIHLSTCSTCRDDVRSFLAFRDELEPQLQVRYGPAARESRREKVRWNWWQSLAFRPAYAAAVVILAICVGLAVIILRRASSRLEAQRTPPSQINSGVAPTPTPETQTAKNIAPTPAPDPSQQPPRLGPTPTLTVGNRQPSKQAENSATVAQLKDEGAMLTVDKAGKISGFAEIPREVQRDIGETLIAENIKAPATATDLAGAPIVLRGPDNPPTFKLLSPAREVILTDRPTFRWQPLPGATSYRVIVGDLYGHEITKSEELSGDRTTWSSSVPLKRGVIYAWEVEATLDGKKVVSPGTSASEMKFKILDSTQLQKLEELKNARSHLALGVFYAHQGMISEAEREFEILVRDNPRVPVLRKLLKQIQSWRR